MTVKHPTRGYHATPSGIILQAEDFPLAQVGNLLISPNRGTVMTCADVPIARQVAHALNWQAMAERPDRSSAPWLTLQ